MNSLFAVITDASSKMGLEVAKQLGTHGYELLISSNTDEIFEVQRTLEDLGIVVEAIKVNLGTYAGVEIFHRRIETYGKKLDVLAINSIAGPSGEFLKTDLREEIGVINFNIISMMHLLKRVLPDMKLRGEGQIIMTSSITSHEVVNGAIKTFLRSFTNSLRHELKDSGVKLTVLKSAETLYSESIFMRLKSELQRRWTAPEHLS